MHWGISLGIPPKAQSKTSAERSQQLIPCHRAFKYLLPGTGWRWSTGSALNQWNLTVFMRACGKEHILKHSKHSVVQGHPKKTRGRHREPKEAKGWFCVWLDTSRWVQEPSGILPTGVLPTPAMDKPGGTAWSPPRAAAFSSPSPFFGTAMQQMHKLLSVLQTTARGWRQREGTEGIWAKGNICSPRGQRRRRRGAAHPRPLAHPYQCGHAAARAGEPVKQQEREQLRNRHLTKTHRN